MAPLFFSGEIDAVTGDDPLSVVIGLGNPGERYRSSRHNIGFDVVEVFARRYGAEHWVDRETYRGVEVSVGGRVLLLVQPLTFMNRSGEAVEALMGDGVRSSEILVVVDDIDLPLGRLRLKRRGGPGTHNGLRSICAAVGEEFPRLRIGVRSGDPEGDLADYVLSPFPEERRQLVARVIERAADTVEAAVVEGITEAMNRFNGIVVEDPVPVCPTVHPDWEWADVVPRPTVSGRQEGDVIVLDCPRPRSKSLGSLGAWFRWWMGPQRIRLDETGSRIWRMMDGETSLGEIADRLIGEDPDHREHLETRLEIYVRTLRGHGLVELFSRGEG